MKKFKLSETGERGWFAGAFDGAAFKTDLFEAAYQFNARGERTECHYHKIATEINLIATGRAHFNGIIFEAGDIFILEPGEICSGEYLEDTITVCIKTPGALNDKYLI